MEPWRAVDAHNGGVEAQKEPWRVYGPEVTDSHYLNDEQDPDPDPDPHLSEADPQLLPTPARKVLPVSQLRATCLSPASKSHVTFRNLKKKIKLGDKINILFRFLYVCICLWLVFRVQKRIIRD
jgi:hypothetical protein